ncbi:pH-response regulator protein palA/rim20 [Malassezia obtusa]|uniref:PH-response regulator protein palA/rim20 n=1 Tax=Malassezia obtusa TaxID=76774 RepID=A0AAF0E2C9_9BASI|nr:pH-response regulator protein palA/rim20 [Malassezia obtusa]
MANVLGLGVPRSAPVPLREGVRAYLGAAYPDVHAGLFDADMEAWSAAREACIQLPIAAGSVPVLLRYAAQLAFLLRVLTSNAGAKDAAHTPLGFAFPWASGLDESRLMPYASLAVERACIVQCVAAQYAQLGRAEPRSDKESIRRATGYFQHAAGSLEVLETLAGSDVQHAQPPAELATASIQALRYLMLAQAQECFWQKAMQDALKDTTIAKLARSVADLYDASASAAASSPLPQGYKVHMRFKQLHFAAAAQYRKSCDDLAQKRYGDELGRLTVAAACVRRALALPVRTLPAPALVDDLRGLQAIVEANLARAERDNQLIYLESTTSEASLPDLGTAVMARAAPPDGLAAPLALLPESELWFRGLITYGIDVAERLYSDRKRHFIEATVEPRLAALDAEAAAVRAELQLPALLDRIESPRRAPPAWAACTAALQRSPPSAVPPRVAGVEHESALCADLLAELETPLFRARPHAAEDVVVEQHELQTLWREYQRTLREAAVSDATLREQWARVQPDRLAPASSALERVRRNLAPALRALRAELEHVDDGAAQRRALLQRVRAACDGDTIRAQLVAAARARHLGAVHACADAEPVDPAALQDVLEAGMEQYTPYLGRCDELARAQAARLRSVRTQAEALQRDAALRTALQQQDEAYARVQAAYDEYGALVRHVDEGAAFYERLLSLLRAFRGDVHAWRERAAAPAPQWGAFPGGEMHFRE